MSSKIIFFAFIACLFIQASATGIYYTFAGEVNSISSPSYPNLHVGDSVKYTFFIDTTRQGVEIHHDREIIYDIHNPYESFWFADYVGGSAEPSSLFGGDVYYHVTENITGEVTVYTSVDSIDDYVYRTWSYGRVRVGNQASLESWYVGQADFWGYNEFNSVFPLDQLSADVRVWSNLTLTDISEKNPMVPEPTGFICFITIGGFFLFKRQLAAIGQKV